MIDHTQSAKEALADVLSDFARTMATDFPIQGILDQLVGRIVAILPISAAGVTLIAPGREPRYVAASDASALRYEMLQSELSEGPCVAAYSTGEAISVPDLRVDDRFPRFAPRALASGLTAVFTFPLRHQDVRLGALDLYRDQTGDLSSEAMTSAQTLADVAAAYLINAQARSDLQDSSDQSREAALHDPLTGLPNRVLMLEFIEHAVRAERRSGRISAVFFMDLDRFKEVNDTYGHRLGDELLVAVAERLNGLLRPGDSLGRLSGDEFVILVENITDPNVAHMIADRFDTELARPFVLSGVELTASASIGIAFTGDDIDSPEALLHDADLAMYRAKRDRTEGIDNPGLRRWRLAGNQASLARLWAGASSRGELHLEYQPVVAAADARVVAVEALLRWTHPLRGPVSPTVFIPFAERSGQIVEVGRWVLEKACADTLNWQQQPTGVAVSVNVSAHQFMSAGFAQTVALVLARTATSPSLLTLEVTESVFIRDEQRALVVFAELNEIGVKLALDDFGTGYSSLGYLNTLPIDTIKIDRTFIARLSAERSSKEIVTAIVGLGHGLGKAVLTEGIETAQQYQQVRHLGCDFCQGFYFATPMSAPRVEALLSNPTDGHGLRLPISATAR